MTIIERVKEVEQLRQVAFNHSQTELAELLETHLNPVLKALVTRVKNGTFESSDFLLEFASKASGLFYKILRLAEEKIFLFMRLISINSMNLYDVILAQ